MTGHPPRRGGAVTGAARDPSPSQVNESPQCQCFNGRFSKKSGLRWEFSGKSIGPCEIQGWKSNGPCEILLRKSSEDLGTDVC